MKRNSLKLLAEALKSLSMYPDRDLIDYWRTIQGTPVGFHGKVGSGVPIAGPAVLTSNDAASNPLMKPLLSKYKPNTFIGDAIRKPNFPVSVINFIENFVGKDEEAINARFAKMEKRLIGGISRIVQTKDKVKILSDEQREYIREMDKKFVEKFLDGEFQKQFIDSNGEKRTISAGHPQVIGFSFDDDGNIVIAPSNIYEKIPEVVEFVEQVKGGFPENPSFEPVKPVTMDELKKVLASKNIDSDRSWSIFNAIDNPTSICEDVFSGNADSIGYQPASKDYKKSQDVALSRILSHFNSTNGLSSVFYKIAQIEGVSGRLVNFDLGADSTEETVEKQIGIKYDEAKEFMGDLYALNQVIMRLKGMKSDKVFRSFGSEIPSIHSKDESIKIMAEIGKHNVPTRFVNRPIVGFASDDATFRGLGVSAEMPSEAILSSFHGARVQGSRFEEERETLVIGASSLQFKPDQIGAVGPLIKADEDGDPVDKNGTKIPLWASPVMQGTVISTAEIVKILSGEEGLKEVLDNRKISKLQKNSINTTPQFRYFAEILYSAGITDKMGRPLVDKYKDYAKNSAEWIAAKLADGNFDF